MALFSLNGVDVFMACCSVAHFSISVWMHSPQAANNVWAHTLCTANHGQLSPKVTIGPDIMMVFERIHALSQMHKVILDKPEGLLNIAEICTSGHILSGFVPCYDNSSGKVLFSFSCLKTWHTV